MNDPAVLRKRIAELEIENRKLKEVDQSSLSKTMGIGGKG